MASKLKENHKTEGSFDSVVCEGLEVQLFTVYFIYGDVCYGGYGKSDVGSYAGRYMCVVK